MKKSRAEQGGTNRELAAQREPDAFQSHLEVNTQEIRQRQPQSVSRDRRDRKRPIGIAYAAQTVAKHDREGEENLQRSADAQKMRRVLKMDWLGTDHARQQWSLR